LELVKRFTGCDERVIHEFGFWVWCFSPEFTGSELKELTQIRSVEIYAHSGSPQDRFIAIGFIAIVLLPLIVCSS
jgi:hypothetical protein